MTQPLAPHHRLPQTSSRLLGIGCGLVAFLFLVTWWLDPGAQPAVGDVRLAPNTAVCLALLGLGVWLSTRERGRRWSQGLAATVVAIALVTLLEYALRLGSLIDHWVVPGVALRPSLQTAVSLVFAGLAVALLDLGPARRWRVSEVFAVFGMAIPLLAILGYAYRIASLYQTSDQAGMSLPTAVLLIGIGLATLLARPGQGWMAVLTGPTLGGTLLRTLLPVLAVLPSVLGWLILEAVPEPHGSLANRVALLMAGFTLLLVTLLVGGSVLIDRLDRARQHANQTAEAARTSQLATLEESNRYLRQLNQYKDHFLGILSHELRTPLNFIMGFASILDDGVYGPLNGAQQGALQKIISGADRLTGLVDDLLDVARMQAGKLSLATDEVDYDSAVGDLIDELAPLASARRLTLEADLQVGRAVCLDPQRMAQVLTNLIQNAIKFTPDGGRIRVATRVEGDSVVTTVSDTGTGIAPEHLAVIFERFTQVDMSSTRSAGGVGLGLSIARGLVEAHGGTIAVTSQLGAGSTFTVAIPLTGDPCESAPASPETGGA